MAKTSQAKIKANAKWNQKNMVQLAIRMYPQQRDAIRQAAADAGLSLAQYVITRCLPQDKQE